MCCSCLFWKLFWNRWWCQDGLSNGGRHWRYNNQIWSKLHLGMFKWSQKSYLKLNFIRWFIMIEQHVMLYTCIHIHKIFDSQVCGICFLPAGMQIICGWIWYNFQSVQVYQPIDKQCIKLNCIWNVEPSIICADHKSVLHYDWLALNRTRRFTEIHVSCRDNKLIHYDNWFDKK